MVPGDKTFWFSAGSSKFVIFITSFLCVTLIAKYMDLKKYLFSKGS